MSLVYVSPCRSLRTDRSDSQDLEVECSTPTALAWESVLIGKGAKRGPTTSSLTGVPRAARLAPTVELKSNALSTQDPQATRHAALLGEYGEVCNNFRLLTD